MLSFQIIIFVAILFGIVLIVFSLILFNHDNKNTTVDNYAADNTIKAIDASITEMDKTMEEFNKVTKAVFEEIEQRYQELLFLYSLIDEKKNVIAQMYSNPSPSPVIKQEIKTDYTVSNNTMLNHPMHGEIIKLKHQGLSIPDIAKKLNMGQGEVKLIIELGKAR